MSTFFDRLAQRLGDGTAPATPSPGQRPDRCRCGQPVFFGNSQCLACQAPLGFEPLSGHVVSLSPAGDGLWTADGGDASRRYRRCANLVEAPACSWLVEADDPHALCRSCRLNRTIPDLGVAGNDQRWARFETAKQRLVAQLLALGLPVNPLGEDPAGGLAFDFLGPDLNGQQPVTGHAEGLITLNIEEADDARREQLRTELHEPYRTLLGHFRHESGHYYWDRLVARGPWLGPFRRLFGDEREDYAAALQRHYEQGPPADWNGRFISAYASMHPWEDWAETWAHYLHLLDTLDTALGFGLRVGGGVLAFTPFTHDSLSAPDDHQADDFLALINAWIELAAMLNELARSMGQPDTYPFVLSAEVVAKLQLVHRIVRSPA